MASILLFALLAFWGQLATGAAACFSHLAPPPETTATVEPQESPPTHRQIQIKRMKAPAPPPKEAAPHGLKEAPHDAE